MSHDPGQPPMQFVFPPPAPRPRISGTAMPHGVFLSTGTVSTASALSLVLTGFTIVSLGIVSLVPTYVLVWLLEEYLWPLHLALPAVLLQAGGPADPVLWGIARAIVNVLAFFVFLFMLRWSPLAGHHAAEHMTVHAIEHFGLDDWEAHAAQMPRAHQRCGSNLLAGLLPAMLVGMPLLAAAPYPAVLVGLGGWVLRHRIGYLLQQHFTTTTPTAAQLERGMQAGRRLVAAWRADPAPRLPLAHVLWRRGLPQMVAGVFLAVYTVGLLLDHVHEWLDW